MSPDFMTTTANPLEGIWRLVEARAWDQHGQALAPPYGATPTGTVQIGNGRMLAVLCNGDRDIGPARSREYTSYGGTCEFDGSALAVRVDLSARADWLGGLQVRNARLDGERLVLRPPLREYGGVLQQRELVWERIWRPVH